MIPRYTRRRMADHWSDENRYRTWLKVELAALDAQAEIGLIPEEAANEIAAKARNLTGCEACLSNRKDNGDMARSWF